MLFSLGDGEVAAPLFDILALLAEADLWRSWAPTGPGGLRLTAARRLGSSGVFHFVNQTEISLPFPLADRHLTFAVDGVDCLASEDSPQQVLVLLDSAPEHVERILAPAPAPPPSLACDLIDSGIVLTPAAVWHVATDRAPDRGSASMMVE